MATEKLRQFASAAAAAAVNMTRPNYFDTSKRGEIYELRAELNSDIHLVRKEAVKKVIASMTLGKDVSSIFPDVLKNVHTEDLELKKLVYLYLMNYATSQPELVVLAINTFCKDAEDKNPMIRALAIRTMGCIRVDKVLDYLCAPLEKALDDKDPYVRVTAVNCVSKVFSLSADLAIENGFVEKLRELLSDGNALVVSNALTALLDIRVQASGHSYGVIFTVDAIVVSRLLHVLNDCSEWGQISIVDTIAEYQPKDSTEALSILEKITSRLQHSNSSVVLSSIKVIVILMDFIPEENEIVINLKKKLAPPIVSLLSTPFEVQYVALRNINLLLQKRIDILENAVRVFFCKYNDPLYVKMEKLEIITLLVDSSNCDFVISELGEYAKEVDLEFARKAMITIAMCTIKIPSACNRTFALFNDLLLSGPGNSQMTQSIAIAMSLLLRKYPDDGLEVVEMILMETTPEMYDEDDSRVAIVWIAGSYGHLFPKALNFLETLIETFLVENDKVQSEMLTAAIKLFFQNQNIHKSLLKKIISLGLKATDNNELRERCVTYGRLLDLDPSLVTSLDPLNLNLQPPQIQLLEKEYLDRLIPHLATVASVYHSIPKAYSPTEQDGPINNDYGRVKVDIPLPDLLSLDDNPPPSANSNNSPSLVTTNSLSSIPVVTSPTTIIGDSLLD